MELPSPYNKIFGALPREAVHIGVTAVVVGFYLLTEAVLLFYEGFQLVGSGMFTLGIIQILCSLLFGVLIGVVVFPGAWILLVWGAKLNK